MTNCAAGVTDRTVGEPEIVIVATAEPGAAAAAGRIATALSAAVAERGIAHWATTGGSTPGAIYRHLAVPPLHDDVPWQDVHLWWGDDRWVSPADPLSNAIACWDLLIREVPIPVTQVHAMPIGEAMDGGRSPAWVAERYTQELRDAAVPSNAAGFPVLDVVHVGVGSDGHVLSVFPGSSTWEDPAWVQPVAAPAHIAPHVERVTLHPRILEAARLPLAVVVGAMKAEIVGRIFGPRVDERELPALLARRQGALWILDEAAAARLPSSLRGTPSD